MSGSDSYRTVWMYFLHNGEHGEGPTITANADDPFVKAGRAIPFDRREPEHGEAAQLLGLVYRTWPLHGISHELAERIERIVASLPHATGDRS